MNLFLRTGRKDEADALVIDFHYSARPPANVQQVVTWHLDGGLFGGDGPAVAACYFSIPPTRWSEEVWELSRLVRKPECSKPLTGLIADACTLAKKDMDLLISFADKTQGHHGGIYQAASWNYAGARERAMDGVMIAGRFHAGRSCNSVWGTRSPEKLTTILKQEVLPHYDEGKHCYWRALSGKGQKKAQRLELMKLPYPKPVYKTDQLGTYYYDVERRENQRRKDTFIADVVKHSMPRNQRLAPDRRQLSREWVDQWRMHFHHSYPRSTREINALCDLALSAESLSRRVAELEAERDALLRTNGEITLEFARQLDEALQRKDGQ